MVQKSSALVFTALVCSTVTMAAPILQPGTRGVAKTRKMWSSPAASKHSMGGLKSKAAKKSIKHAAQVADPNQFTSSLPPMQASVGTAMEDPRELNETEMMKRGVEDIEARSFLD